MRWFAQTWAKFQWCLTGICIWQAELFETVLINSMEVLWHGIIHWFKQAQRSVTGQQYRDHLSFSGRLISATTWTRPKPACAPIDRSWTVPCGRDCRVIDKTELVQIRPVFLTKSSPSGNPADWTPTFLTIRPSIISLISFEPFDLFKYCLITVLPLEVRRTPKGGEEILFPRDS